MGDSQTGVLEKRVFPRATTFGPSRNDILSALEGVFGPPAHPEKLDEYTDYHAAVYDLPSAYLGQSVLVRETLNNLITDAVENWQTTDGLPFRFIDGLTVNWDEIHFDRSILPRVPYEGASRFQTSIRRTHRDRVLRRGAAMLAESDFFRTPEGVRQFSNEVLSIKQCVQLTCNYDVMFAYLTHGNYARDYEIRKQYINVRNVLSYMRREISTYAVLCKGDGDGLDIALETARRLMSEYEVTPNMVIMDPATQLYLRMVPNENKQDYLAGERGVERYDNFNGGRGISDYRGLRVYVQHAFDVGEASQNVNMLERHTQVGEYYVMTPPKFMSTKPLPENYMNLTIFDENMDMLKVITLEEVVNHACPWLLGLGAANADPFKVRSNAAHIAMALKSYNLLEAGPKAAVDAQIDTKTSGTIDAFDAYIDKFLKSFDYTQKGSWEKVVALATSGVWMPFTFVITRPFIEHRMLSMIVTVAGSDTGATMYGQSDFQIARNVSVKMIEGHFTFHSKAMVFKPQNIFILEDVQCNGYTGGCDTTWFGDKTAQNENTTFEAKVASINAGDTIEFVESELKERLDKDHDDDPSAYASMLAFAAPYEPQGTFVTHQMFAISGAPLAWEPNMTTSRSFPGGKAFFDAYRKMFGLDYIAQNTDATSVVGGAFLRNGIHNNSVCILGPSRSYNPLKKHEELIPGQGHFGPDAVAGDARWRRGECINAKQTRAQYTDAAKVIVQA